MSPPFFVRVGGFDYGFGGVGVLVVGVLGAAARVAARSITTRAARYPAT